MQQQKFNIIYKQGDDLRQDYVIIQIIRFIDHLLKELDSDFKLTPYKI